MERVRPAFQKDPHRFAVCFPVLLLSLLSLCSPLHAMQPYFPFGQIVQRADLVFLGSVLSQQARYGTKGQMIFTHVYFSIEKIIHQKETSYRFAGNRITLTFAGGRVQEKAIYISDVPSFETGGQYLLFTRMDGKTYTSPIVGAYQGLFRIIQDERTRTAYPLTYGGHCIVKVTGGELVLGPSIARIQGGSPEKKMPSLPIKFYEEPPRPVYGKGARVSEAVRKAQSAPDRIMALDEFIQEIKNRVSP